MCMCFKIQIYTFFNILNNESIQLNLLIWAVIVVMNMQFLDEIEMLAKKYQIRPYKYTFETANLY